VDWYSMVLLMLFPRVEKDLCQGFIDSIQAEDPTPRFYHNHARTSKRESISRSIPSNTKAFP
jgi:uncharacterized protein (DUF608 family)